MTKKPEAERDAEELVQQAMVPEEDQPYKVPENWLWVPYQIVSDRVGESVSPFKFPEEIFELYSVPSWDNYSPEFLVGDAIRSSKQAVEPGDVLLCKINPRINRVWFVNDKHTYRQIASSEWIICRPGELFSSKCLMYYFASPFFRDLMNSNVSGVGGSLTRARPKTIVEYPIPLPPLPEQQRIVSVIEALFSKLDRARELLEEVQDAFEEHKATILARAFRGELTAKWRAERGVKFEKEWKKEPLENLCDSVSDGDHQPPPQTEEGIPFLVISNIASGEIDFSDTRFVSTNYYKSLSNKRRPQIGDILFSVTGSFGIPAMVKDDSPFCFQRHIALIRPNRIDNTYLYYFLQNPEVYQEISSIATGVAQLTVPIRGLRQLFVPVPPKEEQQEIVRILDNLLDQSSAAASLCDQLEQIDQLKKTILAKAFRGELNTNDPTEESAEKLLRDVLRQRAAVGAGKAKVKRMPLDAAQS